MRTAQQKDDDAVRGHVIGVAAAMILKSHRAKCRKHEAIPRNHVAGVLIFNAVLGTVRCHWCCAEQTVGAFPDPNVVTLEVLDAWACKLITAGDAMFEIHPACIPDPKRNGVVAKLQRLVTADGIADLDPEKGVAVGDEYIVFPHTSRLMAWGKADQPDLCIERDSFYVWRSKHGAEGFMPIEFFEVKPQ
jgi:hypothetical protein